MQESGASVLWNDRYELEQKTERFISKLSVHVSLRVDFLLLDPRILFFATKSFVLLFFCFLSGEHSGKNYIYNWM